jgi:hypothetical protein
MNFFQRRKILKNTNALDLIPVRKCEHQLEESGKVTILVPKFKNPKVSKYMLGKKSPFIFMHLDEIGSVTWLHIDGIRNISDISSALKEQFGETLAQSEQRVNKFMSRLYQERYITFKQLMQNNLPK